MKKIITLSTMAALLAGCASNKSADSMPTALIFAGTPKNKGQDEIEQIAAAQNSLATQLFVVKRSLDEATKSLDAARGESERIEAKAAAEREALLEALKPVKAIKDRVDILSAQQVANQTAIMQAEQDVAQRERDLKRIADEIAATPKQIGELQAMLVSAKKQLEDASGRAKQTAADLELEKRQRAAEAEAARKRESELAAASDAASRRAAEAEALAASSAATAAVAAPAVATTTSVSPESDSVKLVAEGNRELAAGRVAEARKIFEAVLKSKPAMGGALVGLAACQYQEGDVFAAAKTADRALDLNPLDAQALGVKGLTLRKSGDLSAASATLEKAVKADPGDARLRNYLAITLSERKRNAEAIEHLRKAVELDAGYGEAHFNLAYLLATAAPPQINDAREHYTKAVSLGSARDEDLEKIVGPGK